MPGMDGIDVLRSVKAAHPRLKVIVLTMHAGREYVARAMKGGADAYLLKDSAVQDLVAAVHAVVAGQTYFSPTIQQTMAGLLRGDDAAPASRVAAPHRPGAGGAPAGWPAGCPARRWRRR